MFICAHMGAELAEPEDGSRSPGTGGAGGKPNSGLLQVLLSAEPSPQSPPLIPKITTCLSPRYSRGWFRRILSSRAAWARKKDRGGGGMKRKKKYEKLDPIRTLSKSKARTVVWAEWQCLLGVHKALATFPALGSERQRTRTSRSSLALWRVQGQPGLLESPSPKTKP